MIGSSRRDVLAGGLALAALGAFSRAASASDAPAGLVIGTRVIEVKGKAATVFGLAQRGVPVHGLTMNAGERFRLRLTNESGEAALIHWARADAAQCAGWRAGRDPEAADIGRIL